MGGAAGPGGTVQFVMSILGKWQCHSFALSRLPRAVPRATEECNLINLSRINGAGLEVFLVEFHLPQMSLCLPPVLKKSQISLAVRKDVALTGFCLFSSTFQPLSSKLAARPAIHFSCV